MVHMHACVVKHHHHRYPNHTPTRPAEPPTVGLAKLAEERGTCNNPLSKSSKSYDTNMRAVCGWLATTAAEQRAAES